MNRNRVVRCLMFAVLLISLSAGALGEVFVSVRIGPPALPVYVQPVCPGPGYIWTPGYWAWSDDDGYYWVPGTWVVAPVGMLWTPGYWGWDEGVYVWHGGYWGPHIGFYGGINYGFGYTGVGFVGGEWRGDRFYYNRSVTNVNVTNVTNVYNKTVIVNNNTRISYNGGDGGVRARPRPEELRAEHERHQDPLPMQREHMQAAARNPELRAAVNHGRPAVAATVRPADFHSAVPAKAAGAAYHAPAMSPREARGPAPSNRESGRGPEPSNNRESARGNSPRGNDGYRPFNPPSRNNNSNNRPEMSRNDRPNGNERSNSARQSRPENNYHPQSQNNYHPQNESRPQNTSRPAPQQREAAPARREPAPAPQHHESAPREPERHPGHGK